MTAFVALAVVASSGLGGSIVALPTGLKTLVNVVPLAVVPAVAAGGYVLVLSGYFWLVAKPEA